MKQVFALLVVLVGLVAFAQDGKPPASGTFSKHGSALTFVSYDEESLTYTFRGRITLSGTLYVTFDMESENRASGDIIDQRFVPDAESLAQLPAIVGGRYPAPVRFVALLHTPQSQLELLFGGAQEFSRISHGSLHEVGRRATVELDGFGATVECDTRTYYSNVISVKAPVDLAARPLAKMVHGC